METPDARGRRVARLFARVSPGLLADLESSDLLPSDLDATARATARREWDCFALYACVRGLVAAGGFNRETAESIESMHEQAMSDWESASPGESSEERRRLLSERYEEYGTIGGEGGAAGAATVGPRLGEAAARHIIAGGAAEPELVTWLGAMHESIAEGVVEALRRPPSSET